ncbi:MAG: hypothetical protein AAF577_01065 [Pseudomonadota bacterium]
MSAELSAHRDRLAAPDTEEDYDCHPGSGIEHWVALGQIEVDRIHLPGIAVVRDIRATHDQRFEQPTVRATRW